ncbi:hypothetical protein C8D77_111126 [Mesorhizobium loti]|uniref:Uncharacterized protein n=1 Tax=Rhizobium loti TaxID=381 RepID=A0A8E3B2S1_RHILI|nr:hypothetical protein [Mesorhizobium loti]PWJ88403.1 hypothetical protein C8D77_111126 [Mesorhizobium loti]
MSDQQTPPRPTRLTPEMALRAGRVVAEQLSKDGHIEPRQFNDAAADIARHGRPHMDGYKLAKALDDDEGWDCDMQMVEALDDFSHAADKEIKAAQKAWAEANDIKPPFPVGTSVIARWGGDDYPGTIDQVFGYGVAQYAVKADGETGTTRMIVDYENVREAVL